MQPYGYTTPRRIKLQECVQKHITFCLSTKTDIKNHAIYYIAIDYWLPNIVQTFHNTHADMRNPKYTLAHMHVCWHTVNWGKDRKSLLRSIRSLRIMMEEGLGLEAVTTLTILHLSTAHRELTMNTEKLSQPLRCRKDFKYEQRDD